MTKDDYAEDIEASHAELDYYGTDRAQDTITNLYMIHRKDPETFGRLAMRAIELEVDAEAAYRADRAADAVD